MSLQGWMVAAILALSGCQTTQALGDLPLQWRRESARLRIIDDKGAATRITDNYLAIPGYILLNDDIILHPGRHRITYACPGDWDWRNVTHYVPSVEHTFKKGMTYALYCVDGYPEIRQIVAEE